MSIMKSLLPGVGGALRRDADCAEQLRHAAEATQAIAIIITAEDDAVTFWNPGARRMFGHEAHEMIGRPIAVLVEPGGYPPSPDECAGEPMAEQPSVRTACWYRQKHGGLVYATGTTVAVDPANGGGCVWFLRDAAPARKRQLSIERRLLELERTLDEARRTISAKDRFLAVMSHEIKQPLTELLLNAGLLLQMTPSGEQRQLHAIGEAMHCAVRRQARIIDDLLELSRIRTGKLRLELTTVDIAGMVRTACATVALTAPDMQLHVDIRCTGESLCLVDPVRLEQILSNLLGNAVKFSQGVGRVDVQLAIERGHARISVSDTGCGIAAEFLPHVFCMFGQERGRTAAPNTGLGIGLALVHELATAHGGRVEARSDGPGHGAQFTVWLPLADRASPGRSADLRDVAAVLPTIAHSPTSRGIGARQATR
jgi:two-component system, chemotaxis family, CheB/CheR fusion protein